LTGKVRLDDLTELQGPVREQDEQQIRNAQCPLTHWLLVKHIVHQ